MQTPAAFQPAGSSGALPRSESEPPDEHASLIQRENVSIAGVGSRSAGKVSQYRPVCTTVAKGWTSLPPAICRSSYIHPDVLALAERTSPLSPGRRQAAAPNGLRAEEGRLLAFLSRPPRRKG